jgi:hypothetical protein
MPRAPGNERPDLPDPVREQGLDRSLENAGQHQRAVQTRDLLALLPAGHLGAVLHTEEARDLALRELLGRAVLPEPVDGASPWPLGLDDFVRRVSHIYKGAYVFSFHFIDDGSWDIGGQSCVDGLTAVGRTAVLNGQDVARTSGKGMSECLFLGGA